MMTVGKPIKYMDLEEFIETGYLLEINRQFLHPLGLAMAISCEEDGTHHIAGIVDSRDDQEGFVFAALDEEDREKAKRVTDLWIEKARERLRRFGWIMQPMESCAEGWLEEAK